MTGSSVGNLVSQVPNLVPPQALMSNLVPEYPTKNIQSVVLLTMLLQNHNLRPISIVIVSDESCNRFTKMQIS